ncbi:LuxR C-terminal-related transcriptional regulator [Arthrobacter sp. 35W]|uniref:LuxR C-terminal-related transcriptional regulator n=1 Tax=Arthrobacter sp. 35W TaxID=1132441 RepID=UPI001E4CCCC7|nr:LuxR C-terminal-related transcriptional regulator [Arthrobacter sp. 35W]
MDISEATFARALEFVEGLAEVSAPAELAPYVLSTLTAVVGCDASAVTALLLGMEPAVLPAVPAAGAGSGTGFTEEQGALVPLLVAPLRRTIDRLFPSPPPAPGAAGWEHLVHRPTERECVVLALVADGGTNAAIAHRLGCSQRTVAKHLEHVYRKLGVCSRAEAAVWFASSVPGRPG